MWSYAALQQQLLQQAKTANCSSCLIVLGQSYLSGAHKPAPKPPQIAGLIN